MSARKIGPSWWVDFRFGKTRYRKRSPLNTRDGALDYEANIRQKLARGEPITVTLANGRTFADFAAEWMRKYVSTNNRNSEQISKKRKLAKHILPYFGHLALHEVTALKIENFKTQKFEEGLSPKSINNFLTILNKCLQTAQEWQLLARVPKIRWMRVPPQRAEHLSPEECEQLLEAAKYKPFWRNMIFCGLRTGLRLGELIGLRWEDIDLDRRTIHVNRSVVYGIEDAPKNNRTRVVPLCADIYECLLAFPSKKGLVFPQPNGDPLNYNLAQWGLGSIRLRIGMRRIGWHALRHTFASQLVTKGVSLRAVQELLGHSTIQMTMRYSHLAPSTLHAAVQVLNQNTQDMATEATPIH